MMMKFHGSHYLVSFSWLLMRMLATSPKVQLTTANKFVLICFFQFARLSSCSSNSTSTTYCRHDVSDTPAWYVEMVWKSLASVGGLSGEEPDKPTGPIFAFIHQGDPLRTRDNVAVTWRRRLNSNCRIEAPPSRHGHIKGSSWYEKSYIWGSTCPFRYVIPSL